MSQVLCLCLFRPKRTRPFSERGFLSGHAPGTGAKVPGLLVLTCMEPDSKAASTDVFLPDFLAQIPDPPAVPPLKVVDMADVGAGVNTPRMRPGQTTGVYGVRAMPEPESKISWSCPGRSRSRTVLHICAKKPMADCPPITVCATIYKLFASTVTKRFSCSGCLAA